MSREQSSHNVLREDAELRLNQQGRAQAATQPMPHADNPQRLLHELQVYQVELELQNEQLEAARAWIEAALASYTELYDFAPVPYFTLTRTGAITETNLAGARLLGSERSRVIDKRLGVFVAESDRPRVAACLKSLFATQSDAHCEATLVARDGTRRTVEMSATLANDGESCRAVLVDVSERSARERQTRRLADAFTLAPEAMFLSDQHGIITDINHAFTALTGFAHDQVLGRHRRMLFCESRSPGLDEDIAHCLALKGSWSGDIWNQYRDGAPYRVAAHIGTMRDSSGAQCCVTRFSRHD
ncbi:diguanylate cyclase/phosphodiesterase (GGDEF & EAL domains) with PAS/PAC sensor(s) [Janthinobacterium sp. CG23_2]|nr:diguanylate cyclase/phosphodiesterase (GGDEF & EAL domains) with PAS/PAC sensor(s) [Janthinobacterium sp. CG23_2]CUU32592.1 diguanylate cyclase/phosphodiesterase (GGDEF & EAL domains) with PAS/PAC sensor(s) [Janthinobacterium sp. CG23_2]